MPVFSQSAGEGACRSDEVAELITDLDPDHFLALGDLGYNDGSLDQFLRVYDHQFGHLKPITIPAPGSHEYETPGAQGYFDYFGAAAHGPEGYYSFDLGAWARRVVELHVCRDDPGCGPGTPQYEWLAADLAAHDDATCTLAFQHHPTFDWRQWQKFVDPDSDNPNGGAENAMYRDLWRLMDGAGVDVLLIGHKPITGGRRSTRTVIAIRTGSAVHGGHRRSLLYPLGKKPRPANLLAVQNRAFGVLHLTLREDRYDFAWVGLPTDPAFTDAGSFACR